jgi:uncharacterized damage-inducible protein DinB
VLQQDHETIYQYSDFVSGFLWWAGAGGGIAADSARGSSVRKTFLSNLTDLEKKLVSLAEAIPQDKYAWRPGKGVRSVSEVFMHTALSNYYFTSSLGVKPPSEISEDAEKTITQKAKMIETLKMSVAFVRRGVTNLSDADLKKTTNVEGQQTSTKERYSLFPATCTSILAN